MSLDDADFSLAIAFATGRVANALILHPASDFRGMVATGHASPGGVYLSLKDYPKQCAMMLGLPMICSQTFMEEFIFEGCWSHWANGYLASSVSHRVDGSSEYYGFLHCIWAYSFRPCILLLTRKEHWDPALCADNADYARDGVLRLEPGIIFALARVDRSLRPELCGVPVG